MDINEHYRMLAAELGHLDLEAEIIDRRRTALRGQLHALREFVAQAKDGPRRTTSAPGEATPGEG